ncbi:MAG: hypothetical protein QJR01_02475 [Kyrpidia sp.]|nr:hypothetical protein [Kyrpidia sp.]
MMNVQQLQQAARQVQDLCSQLIAQEQQNASQLNQYGQATLQNMSQLESNAARQLRQIQQLCFQIEQGLSGMANQPTNVVGGGTAWVPSVSYTAPSGSAYGMNAPGISPGTLQQVMQADHNPWTGPWYRPATLPASQPASQPAGYEGQQGGGVNPAALGQVLRADRDPNQTPVRAVGWPSPQTGWSSAQGVNPSAVQQVLQADRGQGEGGPAQRQVQPPASTGYAQGYYGPGTAGINQVMQAAQPAH